MQSEISRQFATGEPVDLLDLDGRILVDGADMRCRVPWVRGRTARVDIGQPTVFAPGRRVIVYLDLIGRVEGTASRVDATGLDLAIVAPPAKWERLRRQFAIVAAMAPEDRVNLRGHRRIAPDRPDVRLTSADGSEVEAQVRDVSRSGAAVTSDMRPEVGSIVTLGATRGRVARLLDGGFAVQFLRLLPLETFGAAHAL